MLGNKRTTAEVLVVVICVGVVALLAQSCASLIGRREARTTRCIHRLHQVGTALIMYANNNRSALPSWLTLLAKQRYLEPNELTCPCDPSRGAEGGRPDRMKYHDTGEIIQQFEMADIDPHEGPFNGVGPKNAKDGGVNASYVFEFSREPCDWIYKDIAPPITSRTVGGVPTSDEWQWKKAPEWRGFVALADQDRDSVLSWNEIKTLSREGNKAHGLPAWGIRVPVVRCYWHVKNGGPLRADSLVLDLCGDGSAVVRSTACWSEPRESE